MNKSSAVLGRRYSPASAYLEQLSLTLLASVRLQEKILAQCRAGSSRAAGRLLTSLPLSSQGTQSSLSTLLDREVFLFVTASLVYELG